jgi:hypothetical protein
LLPGSRNFIFLYLTSFVYVTVLSDVTIVRSGPPIMPAIVIT